MTRYDKLLHRLLSETADRSFRFEDLCTLLGRLGFTEHRRAGSHRIFIRADVAEILNLQSRRGGEAKPYQVRQVRNVVLKYGQAHLLSSDDVDAETDDEA